MISARRRSTTILGIDQEEPTPTASGTLAPMSSEPPPDLDWSPAAPSGHPFPTHRIVTSNSTRLELRATPSARRAVGVFGIMSVFFLAIAVGAVLEMIEEGISVTYVLGVSMCLGFGVLLGWLTLGGSYGRRIFDSEHGCYWPAPNVAAARRPPADAVPLANIRGLQITSERVDTGEGVIFDAYELNLVLIDGRRVNVIDHAGLAKVHATAEQIASFLRVPLWIEPSLSSTGP
jgi:hypothetical protein